MLRSFIAVIYLRTPKEILKLKQYFQWKIQWTISLHVKMQKQCKTKKRRRKKKREKKTTCLGSIF